MRDYVYNAILGNSVTYLMKYFEKTGEKIVYSKDLPQYRLSKKQSLFVAVPLPVKKFPLFTGVLLI